MSNVYRPLNLFVGVMNDVPIAAYCSRLGRETSWYVAVTVYCTFIVTGGSDFKFCYVHTTS